MGSPAGRPTDHELLDRLAAGDELALLELYDRYASVVYGTALHLVAEVEGAADVTEAVFVELWTRSHEHAATPVTLHRLLTGLTHHHAGRRRIRRASRITPMLTCLADPGSLPWS